jgi:hypothetical protein
MTGKYYAVYPVYGEDKGRFILGVSKALSNKRYYHGEVINEAFTKVNSHNFIIIDWKHYQIKYHVNGYESKWKQFKSSEFWNHFRFSTPCEDWEIEAYGHIR